MDYRLVPKDELYHYGVKGMKWGVRKTYKYVGRSHKKSSTPNEDKDKSHIKLTDKQKKAIKIGAIVVGTCLAAYGAYKIHELYTGRNDAIDPTTGFRLLKNSADANDINTINPGRIHFINRNMKGKEIIHGSSQNCMLCTTAYDLRKRGYDVRSGQSMTGYMPDELFSKIYKDYKGTIKINTSSIVKQTIKPGVNLTVDDGIDNYSKRVLKNVCDAIEKEGPGSRGNIVCWWKYGGGHSMIWENVDGQIKFMDGQTGQEYTDFAKQILKNVNIKQPVELLRTDNLEINVPEMKKVINNNTLTKTYIDHGAEIATRMILDPTVLTVGAGAAMIKNKIDEKYQEKGAKNKNDK